MENSLLKIKYRTISSVVKVFDEVTDVVLSWVGNIGKDLSRKQDIDNLLSKMRECVSPKGGEVKARYNTISLGNLYLQLSDVGKARFLRMLNDRFNSTQEEVDSKISEYVNNTDSALEEKLRFELISVLSSPRLSILKQFMSLSEGVKFLVDMRADAITLSRKGRIFSHWREI
ncbi:malonyl-CoA decarboxylase domain protein [Anaplasma phagocytophilum str. ApNP]|uniref:Malonyl-CoA decarboxylase domain protein n=1 Tax=Anaplasma phagocytophilum str. ApNP TaxID=1359153 RepID=A0A0F3NIR8_ANAPH|nr:malonyl-CoA decarboxylase domain protein [Anaplasma phagocytophilum str. ApNP]